MKQEGNYFQKLPQIAQIKASNRAEMETDWKKSLDERVLLLAKKWKLTLGNVLKGGTENLILEARRENGESAILKVALPGSSSIFSEAFTLKTANGKGYAQLYEVDYKNEALLLEKLGSPLSASSKNIKQHIEIICQTLKEAWVSPESTLNLPTSVHKAMQMITFIEEKWVQFNQPFSTQTLNLAYEFFEARIKAYDPKNCVLIHGDAHGFNTLKSQNGNYKLVDPDGLLADKGLDLMCMMRDWSEPLLKGNTQKMLQKRCTFIANLTEVDQDSIWQWGYLGRLVIGLTLLELGETKRAMATLRVADAVSTLRVF